MQIYVDILHMTRKVLEIVERRCDMDKDMLALADKLTFAANNTEGCLYSQRKMLNDAASALRTASNREAISVKVKPLEWTHIPGGLVTSERYDADSAAGVYSIYLRDNGDIEWAINHESPVNRAKNYSDARETAQSDYARRIMSALA